MPLLLKCLLFFAGTALCTFVIQVILLRFASTLGIREPSSHEIRWNQTAKPALGGIAMFISMIVTIFIFLITHPYENIFSNWKFVFFFCGLGLAFLMGLSDDAYNTKPMLKLSSQVLCGVLVSISGTLLPITAMEWVNFLITTLWVVGLMNSLNMLDNMDGITAGVTLSTLLFLTLFGLLFGSFQLSIYALLAIALMGSMVSFLMYNFPPSRMFMGDSGSQLIGYCLSFFVVHFLWNSETSGIDFPAHVVFYITLCFLAMPFIDTFTVVFNRIRRGISPAKGGKDHTTHALFNQVKNEKTVWWTFVGGSLVMGVMGLGIGMLYQRYESHWAILPFGLFYIFFYRLFRNTQLPME
ncbi:MAG: MraY family glycosyltransferase [Flavobacteriales bacterium]